MTNVIESPDLPQVAIRFDGEIGAPLVVVEGASLTPDDAIEYAKAIFSAAARACADARLDIAGHA